MLKKLSVQNYALINTLEIDFHAGFSSVTGETGAGKSIILGALSLILGQRADTKIIKDESKKSVIEGCFDIAAYHLDHFFEEQDLEYDNGICILGLRIARARAYKPYQRAYNFIRTHGHISPFLVTV